MGYTDFTDIDCEGGMCVCWERGGVQMRLFYWSFPCMAAYMFGFPLYVLYIVRRHKILIKEDQLLRAHGVGDTEADNPFAYHIRVKFHRVYYHFKPGKSYWFVIIVFRKFWIAMVGILLKNNPGFQLAVCMLVLLYCYVIQQNNRPYMSTVERLSVIVEHRAKVAEGNAKHTKIESHIAKAAEQAKEKRRRAHRKVLATLEQSDLKSKRDQLNQGSATEYFFDYNTVEAVLLCCAILVCLAGVMFDSSQFADDKAGRYEWQKTLITFMITCVIFGSISYYLTVFASELGVKMPKFLIGIFADKKKASERAAEEAERRGGDAGDDFGEIELTNNPMQKDEASEKAIKEAQEMAQRAEEANQLLAKKLRDNAKALSRQDHVGKAKYRQGKRKKGKKKEFGGRGARSSSGMKDSGSAQGSYDVFGSGDGGKSGEGFMSNPLAK